VSYTCLKFRKSYTPSAAQIRVNTSLHSQYSISLNLAVELQKISRGLIIPEKKYCTKASELNLVL
jgi:hypothetical protein